MIPPTMFNPNAAVCKSKFTIFLSQSSRLTNSLTLRKKTPIEISVVKKCLLLCIYFAVRWLRCSARGALEGRVSSSFPFCSPDPSVISDCTQREWVERWNNIWECFLCPASGVGFSNKSLWIERFVRIIRIDLRTLFDQTINNQIDNMTMGRHAHSHTFPVPQ